MSNGIGSLPRDILARALGGDLRAVRAFEQSGSDIDTNTDRLASTAAATDALNDATVLVLSPNAAFNNERVLKLGSGLSSRDDGTYLTITSDAPHVRGDFPVNLTATQETNLLLPTAGQLATVDQAETLAKKTLSKPLIVSGGNFATDAAASAGGVPVGGIYDTDGVLKFRRS